MVLRLLAVLSLACAMTAHARRFHGHVYYISTSGSDAANGLTVGTAWASPNHAVNCGDLILAQSGTYSASNFASGKWGTVTCSAGNRVAAVICATFDACKITGGTAGIVVSASYWGVLGWEVSTTSGGGPCFGATPPTTAANIHHILFANDIANGCGGGGFSGYNNGAASIDYWAVVGSIAYNAATNASECFSGISVFQPINTDTNAGTHLFFAGNFSYGNVQPTPCQTSGTPMAAPGADGVILDTLDGSQGLGHVYTGQSYVANNITVANSGRGIEQQSYTKNVTSSGITYFKNNTSWGNQTANFGSSALCPDMAINLAYGVVATANISQTTASFSCPTGGATNTLRAFNAYDTSGTTTPSGVASSVSGNLFFAASGSASFSFNDETPPNSFTFGSNTTSTNPGFTSPAAPSAPSCGAATSAYACMVTAGVVSMFTPTAGGTSGFGFQTPILTNGADTLFPKWLCTTGLPYGIFTSSC